MIPSGASGNTRSNTYAEILFLWESIKNIDTRNKIIKCGIELFKRDGYEKTTIPKICEAADVSKGTFYYHFQDKQSCFCRRFSRLFFLYKEELEDFIFYLENDEIKT